MFGCRQPTCPVDPTAKKWLEERLVWLAEQFGTEPFLARPIILPTRDFFPISIDGTEQSLRALLDQVCCYMDADPGIVTLEIVTGPTGVLLVNEEGQYLSTGFGGLYDEQEETTVIHIHSSELLNLEGLVGTMAHELAHLRLLGEKRLTGDEFDNELLTDLTAVFHGFGIFLGNSPRAWMGDFGIWPGTNLRRPEYMTHPMFAYALAHTGWWRGNRKPEWTRLLRTDVRLCFKQALRYLFETGDSTFSPNLQSP